ncbi:MAG: hypothetical protein BWY78_00191 [Alphaproteobacteria bacterium ADurb.Bin438]|nr:MAG: hypothetical protein BWY78_00191 [Alphaproteobacteria bacterium ADurb.Bin438]
MFKKMIVSFIFFTLFFGINKSYTSDEIPSKSIIYYFHDDVRCASCRLIEQYTTEVYNENFKDDFELKVIDISIENNRHFVKDYTLYTKSVILSKIKDGKEVEFKNLDKIWQYLRDKKKSKAYLKEEINNFLKENN